MNDLTDPWLRRPGVDPVDLKRNGVSFRASQMVGGVRQGKRGWMLPCYIDPPSIYRTVDDPVLLDFVSFDPGQPTRWKAIYGYGVMLGEEAFREARIYRLPLPCFRSPLAWLQSGGAGVFPLDSAAFARSVIGCNIRLVAEDLRHGDQLDRAIRAAVRFAYPEIEVPA